ncbi:MAG: FAD-dependent oxidoreductase [Candidatus Pacebacteria bacterium]|nr:FAD-dependent oxidoreductase [Candidatus Paceibacterota bacterium]
MSLKKSVKKVQKTPHVLIIGGGFAGITAANSLAHLSNLGEVNVTLISDKTYFEYYPAFYKVVTGAPAHEVCVPLTDMVAKEVDVVVDRIVAIDLKNKEVKSSKGHIYSADYLVIAIGSETIYFDLPGLKEHSFGFKSIGEAHELKNHIENLFKEKSTSDMVSHFQVVIVGGGPSGVEVAGDLVSNMRKLAKEYSVDPSFITIDIIDRGSRLIGATHPFASAAALRRLRKLGVNVFLNREVMAEDIEKILMGDMSLKTKTVIWTAGTSVNALFKQTEGLQFTERRRVQVNDYLEAVIANAENSTNDSMHNSVHDVYVAGDGAGTKYSGLAQTAIRDGKFVAQDILKKIRKQDRKQYKPKDIEYIIPIGRNWALMSLGPIHIYGYFAYVARELVDFFYFAKILSFKKTMELFFK